MDRLGIAVYLNGYFDMALFPDPLERAFLQAAQDLSFHQEELYLPFAEAFGLDPYTFWIHREGWPTRGPFKRCRYHWWRGRKQEGHFDGWRWGFHGLACDLTNEADGRLVRTDFGPSSRRLAMTGWGVLQYVMTAKSPWRPFPALQLHLAEHAPPYDSLSGNHRRMSEICSRLMNLKLLVYADPELVELRDRYTQVDPSTGKRTIGKPPGLTYSIDVALCSRLVLSEEAHELLEEEVLR